MIYKTILLDCDGVILDSNNIKTEAFEETLSAYPKEKVDEFIRYHQAHGGVSRFEKYKYFLNNIVNDYNETTYQNLLQEFSNICRQKLLTAKFTKGMEDFLKKNYQKMNLWVVSGGMETELNEIFEKRGLRVYFKGILGSPTTKIGNIKKIIMDNPSLGPTLFIGDSSTDYEAARAFDLDFLFIYGYTELQNWENYCSKNTIRFIENMTQGIYTNYTNFA